MVEKPSRQSRIKPRARRVRFSIEAQEARQVVVAGDFNKWDKQCSCLRKKNGRWEKTFSLPPGVYEYKYLVDGQWRMDPANGEECTNCFGTRNNVIVVDA